MLNPRLIHVVTLQEQEHEQDPATGAVSVTWADWLVDEPAEFVPVSGREFIQSAGKQAQVSARATIRWRAGVDPSMRLIFDGRAYNIQAVLPDPSARRWLTLMVSEGPSDGD